MRNKTNKTVFVGVSGGVDSSVSAALLKDAGYTVVGVFIRTWQPDFIECTWRDERRDAMRVCAHLRIPFLECDAEEAYKKGVADYMIEEYKKGNTPNPDVMCNREVKFGVFWDFAKARGADFIATGHYAIISEVLPRLDLGRTSKKQTILGWTSGNFQLKRSPDTGKDQSYFLWTLTQEDLAHTLFPIGHLQKIDVRKLAEKYRLPTATKKDSQGVCFLGPLDMKDFLKHYIESEEGKVLDEEGNVIGTHDGAVFLTLGERHGFTMTEKTSASVPYYVIDKNIEKNTVTVSRNVQSVKGKDTRTYKLKNINWITGVSAVRKTYMAQIRYHGELLECTVETQGADCALITFEKPILVSTGQSIVIYNNDICVGGGVVI